MITEELLLASPCGLYCGECSAFQNGTCKGCRSNFGICLKYRKVCGIFDCIKRKFDFCNNCNDFPCKNFNKFFDTREWYGEVTNNLKKIKKIGLEKWLEEQEKRVNILKECATTKGITHCSQCKDWPCKNLKRPPLTPD